VQGVTIDEEIRWRPRTPGTAAYEDINRVTEEGAEAIGLACSKSSTWRIERRLRARLADLRVAKDGAVDSFPRLRPDSLDVLLQPRLGRCSLGDTDPAEVRRSSTPFSRGTESRHSMP